MRHYRNVSSRAFALVDCRHLRLVVIERPNPMTPIEKTAEAGPAHHPSDELLLDHAIRACLPAEALVIDLHLEFCARCRRIAHDLAAIGGAMLDAIEPAFVSPQMFNKTLQAIGHGGQKTQTEKSPSPRVPAFAAGWPAPLRNRVATDRLKRWRWMPGGFRALRIPFRRIRCAPLDHESVGRPRNVHPCSSQRGVDCGARRRLHR